MLEMIGAVSRAFEHKRLREGLVRLSVYGPGKPEKSEKTRQEVKQEEAKKQDARRKNKKRSGRRRRESRKEKLWTKLPPITETGCRQNCKKILKRRPSTPSSRSDWIKAIAKYMRRWRNFRGVVCMAK